MIIACEDDLLEGVGGDPKAAASSEEKPPSESPTLAQKLRGIWVIGGTQSIAGSTMIREIDLYDPVTDTWYPDVAANATGSYAPTAFSMVGSINKKIYVCGGAISNTTVASTVFEYDIENNSWQTKTAMLQNIMDGFCYVQGNYLYVIGGTNQVTTAGVQTTHYKFDPATNGWSTMTAYATARSAIAGANFNGMVVYAGGRINTGVTQTANDIYIIATNNYSGGTETTIVTSGRAGMAYAGYASGYGNYLFLVGGASGFTGATAYFSLTSITFVTQASSFLVYTPPATTNGWFYGTYHPAFSGDTTRGIVFASASVSPYNGSATNDPTLYVFGGIKNSPPVTVTDEVYAISAEGTVSGTNYVTQVGWTQKTSMPRARYGHRSVTINQ